MDVTETNLSSVSAIDKKREDTISNISGASMDRSVKKPLPYASIIGYGLAVVIALILAWWIFSLLQGGRTLSVNSEQIVVSDVTLGTFEDFIPLRGRLVPRSTVYLDAIEGGRVEQVLVEDGAIVEVGDAIAVLSNTNQQLELLSREAAVTEQLNSIRSIELQLEQNRLSHKRNLVDLDYQIVRLTRSIGRQSELAASNLVSQSSIEDLQDELNYVNRRRELTLESQATDELMQAQQLRQLREAGEQLQAGLGIARKNIEDLNVTAPVSGKLSGFDIEIGESISRGERLGQIDDPEGFKLRTEIDEYYLGRVDLEQPAIADHNNSDYGLKISKIYPQVSDRQFEVDMNFDQEPEGMRRGQTLPLKLILGDNSDAILIPNGSFYQETGGNWIFVVSPNNNQAVRRTVQMGRRNTEFIEILDGLEPGERVVTSPYTSYVDLDRLTLN